MTQSENYVEGKWYGWNGGECPVHPETIVDVVAGRNDIYVITHKNNSAGDWYWNGNTAKIIAFRVVKHYVEPKVVWVNETSRYGWLAHQTKEDATICAGKYATRVAVRYVETPE